MNQRIKWTPQSKMKPLLVCEILSNKAACRYRHKILTFRGLHWVEVKGLVNAVQEGGLSLAHFTQKFKLTQKLIRSP